MIRLIPVRQGTGIVQGAIELLFELLAERPAEANISHAELPSMERHRQFVHRHPYRLWFLVETDDGTRVGAVYATDRNEAGIAILKAHQRKGYARSALTALLRDHKPLPAEPSVRNGNWLANIAPGNAASKALFRSLGFTHIQETFALQRGEDDGKAEDKTEGHARPVR